jgi:hypothetical protein
MLKVLTRTKGSNIFFIQKVTDKKFIRHVISIEEVSYNNIQQIN